MNFNLGKTVFTLSLNIPLFLTSTYPAYAQLFPDIEERLSTPNEYFPEEPEAPTYYILPDSLPYTLDQGDVIQVNVFGLDTVGGVASVFDDGTVTFPLIGRVNVRGLTITEVNSLMTELYSRYLKRPSITVTLQQPRSIEVGIVGEVNTPGNYTISGTSGVQNTSTSGQAEVTTSVPSRPTVTSLLALAGGLTVSADVKQIKLRRQENGREVFYTLDFWQLLQQGDLRQNVDLQDGDVVIVSKKDELDPKEYRQLIDANFGIKYIQPPTVTVVGEVFTPGAYTVPIENGPPTLTSLLQLSNGIRELADIRNIEVRRTTRDTEEQVINVNLWEMLQTGNIEQDIVLRQGDRVIVPRAEDIDPTEAEALATANFSPAQITVNVVGTVVRPGAVALPPNTSLNNAILAAGGFDQVRSNQKNVELVRFNANGTVTRRTIAVDLGAEINEQTNPILKNNDAIIVNRNALAVASDTLGSLFSPFTSVFSFIRLFQIFD